MNYQKAQVISIKHYKNLNQTKKNRINFSINSRTGCCIDRAYKTIICKLHSTF